MKPLRQFVTGLAILGLIVWGLAKLTIAPLTPEQKGEYTSASVSKPPSAAEEQRKLTREVMRTLQIEVAWNTSGFGTVMMANITITNPTPHAVKDIEIWCSTYGASGTKLGELRQTVYKSVKLNMGFIHNQTKKVSCVLSDLIVLRS